MIKAIDKDVHDTEAFIVFAKLHPVEAYDLRPDVFCELLRDGGCNMSDEEIKDAIDSSR